MSGETPFRPDLIAPCGMDCAVCYKHLSTKKPCAGCLAGETGKPGHCRACAIKDCAAERGLSHCGFCPQFPCPSIRRLDRTYRTRYGVSLADNGRQLADGGMVALLADERGRWTCPDCGGVYSLHDGVCSRCGRADPMAPAGGGPKDG